MTNKEIRRKIAEAAKALVEGNKELHFKIYCDLALALQFANGPHAKDVKDTFKKLAAEKMAEAQQALANGNNDLHFKIYSQLARVLKHSNSEQATKIKETFGKLLVEKSKDQSIDNIRKLLSEFGMGAVAAIPMPSDAKVQAELKAKLNGKGITLLETVEQILKTRNFGTIYLYLFTKYTRANINALDNEGFAPIHHLFTTYHNAANFIQTLNILINMGADLSCKDKNGRTLLHLMLQLAKTEPDNEDLFLAIAVLLKKGANPNAELNNGLTPMYFAALTGNPMYVSLLTNQDATVDLKGRRGGLFEMLAFKKDIASLNCLMQGDAAYGVQFTLPNELLMNLDAGSGVVLAFINGKFVDELRANLPGFQNAITSIEQALGCYIAGDFSKEDFTFFLRKSIKFEEPNADEKTIQDKTSQVLMSAQKIIRTQQLGEKLKQSPSSLTGSEFNAFTRDMEEFLTMAQEARQLVISPADQQRAQKALNFSNRSSNPSSAAGASLNSSPALSAGRQDNKTEKKRN